MNRKRWIALLLAMVMALGLVGCGGKTPDAAPDPEPDQSTDGAVTVTDMIGREVTVIPGSYQRVVCIGAGALRIYSYVGDAALLCGVEDIDNTTLSERPKMFDNVARPYVMAYGDVFAQLPSCGVGGPNAQAAEAEKILACQPDIIISEYKDVEKADALQEQVGVPVITTSTGPDGVFDDAFRTSLQLLGQLFGRQERTQELIAFIDSQTAELTSRTAGVADEDRPGVYICGLGNWGTTDHLMTSQSYAAFRVANIRNVATDLGKDGVQPIEAEKFAALGDSMDIMILDAAAVKNIAPLYQEDPRLFDGCKAWENGQVYLEMAYNAYYTNHEIALANAWYAAKVVYPDLFADVDMTAKTNEITRMFLGQELAKQIFACPSSFGGYQQIDTPQRSSAERKKTPPVSAGGVFLRFFLPRQHPHRVFQEHPHCGGQVCFGVEGDAQCDGGGRVHRQHHDVADAPLGDELIHNAHTKPLLYHGHGGEALQRGELHVGHDTRPVEQGHQVVVAALGGHDEPVHGAVSQWIGFGAGKRVVLWQQGQHGVLRQGYPVVGHVLLIAEETDIRRAVVQPLGHLLPDALQQVHMYLRVVPLERADHRRQPVGGDAGIGRDVDAADEQAVHLRRQLEDAVLLPQELADGRQQQTSVLRQAYALGIPAEQRKAEFLLQRRHQLVHAGGRVAQGLRRFGKAAGIRCHHKGSAPCRLHGRPSCRVVFLIVLYRRRNRKCRLRPR